MAYPLVNYSSVIPSGDSIGSAVPMQGRLMSIEMPGAWTAGSLKFQCSFDQLVWTDAYDGFGNLVLAVCGALQTVSIDQYMGANFIRPVSVQAASPGTPVNQGANRSLRFNMLVQPATAPNA